MMQWLQPATLNTSSHCDRRRLHRAIDGILQYRISLLHHDAWETAEHDLDLTDLISTAFGSVGIGQTNGNSLY